MMMVGATDNDAATAPRRRHAQVKRTSIARVHTQVKQNRILFFVRGSFVKYFAHYSSVQVHSLYIYIYAAYIYELYVYKSMCVCTYVCIFLILSCLFLAIKFIIFLSIRARVFSVSNNFPACIVCTRSQQQSTGGDACSAPR